MAAQGAGRPNMRQALESAGAHFLNLVEIGIVKTFIDYKVFDQIVDEGDIAISEVAVKVGGEEALLERFSNYLIAAGILASTAPGRIAHTERSRAYRTGEIAAGFIVHVYNLFLRPMARWTEYFETNGLAEPKDAHKIPLGLATGHPDSDMYGVLDAEPKLAVLFNRAQAGSASIYSLKGVYDFGWLQKAPTQPGERPAIVDIGGGSGLALRDILVDNPFVPPEQCAVLDLPKTIEQTKSQLNEDLRSVRLIGGTMFETLPQPVRGALIYQFRRVLSDFLDNAIVQALKQVREACAPDSRVLIIEELLHPNQSKFSLAQDISVMNFGGKRRSEAMFRKLAAQAGFNVNAVYRGPATDFGVVELLPA
ncbi:putative O-methyltransferase [Xylona heveae TC161]|uniref:Putative O-methyltransferase n=1 Tax=Xylona heveae (strain CBS 132557 / TC161) TaxID=1328760 RepID=A0A165HST5_XYLHT|nr:putative O-methyltransferase [Xylona heveae TC161]KZF23890.1 putative O-methyltransferase [Xylona heveae TC161]